MSNTYKIAYYEFKRLIRDWRLMLILMSEPIVIALIVGFMAYHNPTGITVNVVNQKESFYSDLLISKLKADDKLTVTETSSYSFDDIKSGKYRAIISIDITGDKEGQPVIKIMNAPMAGEIEAVIGLEVAKVAEDISKTLVRDQVQSEVDKSLTNLKVALPPEIQRKISDIKIQTETIQGISVQSESATPFNIRRFDYFASAIMVLMILLVVLNIAGMSITSERSSGTFERLFVTPYSKSSVILGKAMTHFALGIIIALLGVATLWLVFQVAIGTIWLLALITILTVAMAVCLGLMISSLTKTVVESVEVAMYAFFIAVLTSGILSPNEVGQQIFLNLRKILPFYYAVDAARRINLADAGWSQVSANVYYLAGFVILFIFLSIWFLRREAK